MTVPVSDRDEFPEPRIIVHETPVVDAGTLMNGTGVHYLDFRTNPAVLNQPVYTVLGHTSDPEGDRWVEPSSSATGYVLVNPVGRRRVDALTRPGWYVADEQPIGEDVDFSRLGEQAAAAGLPPIVDLDANFVRARALLPHRTDEFAHRWAQGWHASGGRFDASDLADWEAVMHQRFDFTTADRFLTRLVVELRTEIEYGLARAERLPVPGPGLRFPHLVKEPVPHRRPRPDPGAHGPRGRGATAARPHHAHPRA
ncbi:hypothetical protein ACWDSJ_28310 [Nocardia sp. NPDC003482]